LTAAAVQQIFWYYWRKICQIDCTLLCNKQFSNPENPWIWTRAIPGFGIGKTAENGSNAILTCSFLYWHKHKP